MFFDNLVGVRSGTQNRGCYQPVDNGRVTISGSFEDKDGIHEFKRTVEYKDRKLISNKYIQDGETQSHIVYGKFERRKDHLIRFKKGTTQSKHGKAFMVTKLMDIGDGICHSWYASGKLLKQQFIYDNGMEAYCYDHRKPDLIKIRNPEGQVYMEVAGKVVTNTTLAEGCRPIFNTHVRFMFKERTDFEVKVNGKVRWKASYENNQHHGRCVFDGKPEWYLRGVKVTKKVFHTPEKDLSIEDILAMPNSQLRMALMSKIDPERLAKMGKIVHKQDAMRLYAIPKLEIRILRVQCTTTKQFYYLKVPKDATNCEEARQWTFGVGEDFAKPIVFEKET